ncbi:hypothetical protein BH23GEM6_BH23GEM6_09150 [soil metagenome]
MSKIATQSIEAVGVWNIDPTHTLVEFSARHMMITTVKGRFGDVDGAIHFDESEPAKSSVEVGIDAAGIDTRSEQRDQHLRSGDFLDVENTRSCNSGASGWTGRSERARISR